MVSREKILALILRGNSDANIDFRQLLSLLTKLGFEERVKGSHHIFSLHGIPEILNLQPKGSKAKVYQVRQVRNIIVKYQLAGEDDE